ncbi:hypothetical protein NHX12_013625 [Muraenolepis orangiensis]|uniref:PH domain-containing protein n=1 Tax=Muraenolepis orangiensis TaxID=630683 RepID=A0A9Q0DAY6_9TELE|nr:hypothetical protein NHX12_013625 [Muraenolepis orangiensis]
MENQPVVDQPPQPQPQSCEDVRKSGYLRKHKSMHRRYFVLRAASERGAARLEYYESEKKFRGKAPMPKKALALETCFNINKRADAKNKHMIVLYTRAESFTVAAENEADQDEWYQAMFPTSSMGPQLYGPSALWALSSMGPQLYGPSALWALSSMGPQLYGPSALWALSSMGPQLYGPSALWALSSMGPPYKTHQ